jgi:hypothetical protein
MGRSSRARQFWLFVAGASLVMALAIGFWPVSVTVVGDVSYSCGSGLIHSVHTWKADTRLMAQPQATVGTSTTTPNAACPSRVYRHRDFAYALLVLAIGTYLVLLASAAYDPNITPTSTRRSTAHRTLVSSRR